MGCYAVHHDFLKKAPWLHNHGSKIATMVGSYFALQVQQAMSDLQGAALKGFLSDAKLPCAVGMQIISLGSSALLDKVAPSQFTW